MTTQTSQSEVQDKRTTPFFMVSNVIIDHYSPLMGASALLVYLTLIRLSGRDSSCYPSLSTLMKKTGLSKNSILTALKKLTEMKLIEVQKRHDEEGYHLSNLYLILDPACTETGSANFELGSANKGEKMVQNLNDGGSKEGDEVVQNLNTTKTASNKDIITKTTTKTLEVPLKTLPDGVVVFDSATVKTKEEDALLKKMLVEKGVTSSVASRILIEHKAEAIENQIRALAYRKALDPAAILVRSIEQNWSLPAEMQKREKETHKRALRHDKEQQVSLRLEMAQRSQAQLESKFSGLGELEKARLVARAREAILAQPLGARLLQGAVGEAMLHRRCLELYVENIERV